ncbi:MAG: PilZ domain-containing protein [Magnetococcales bacterium]|nr:PilZ domain-containing protein [Magnetococcales bacterium]
MKSKRVTAGLKQEKVLQLLDIAVASRILVNVTLQGGGVSYRTRLLNMGETSDSIFLAPLEPANGNMKIRGSRGEGAVTISFVHNNQTFQGKVTFMGVEIANGSQLLRCSVPEVLQPTEKIRRREENRVIVPNHFDLTVSVAIKGQKKVSGVIEDLSSGGLSFSCPSLSTPFCHGNKVMISISGDVLKGESIPATGIIRRCVVLRNSDKTNICADHYGLQFLRIPTATAMAVDRLVRLRIPESEDAWFMTEQVRF